MAENCKSAKRARVKEEDGILQTGNALALHLEESAKAAMTSFQLQDKDEESFVAEACKKYKILSALPKLSGGDILSCQSKGNETKCFIAQRFSQFDLVNKEVVKFEKSSEVNIDWKTKTIAVENNKFPSRVQENVLQSISKDGTFKAVIRKLTKKDKVKFLLEVWSGNFLQKAINLSDFDVHEDVYSDDSNSSCMDDKEKEEQASNKGRKYEYKEDWGEQKEGLCEPVLVVVDVAEEMVKVVDCIPRHISPGQPIWGPAESTNQSIIFVGWWNDPFKLGLVYCENRRSAIFQVKFNELESKCRQLSDDHCAVHSPKWSKHSSTLVFLERDEGGAHRGCERLMLLSLNSQPSKPTVLYDIVPTASELQIPLFSHSLIDNCWLCNSEFVILQTHFKSNQVIVMIKVTTGQLYQITHEDGCWSLLDSSEDIILASFSSPVVSDVLMIGKVESAGQVCWIPIQNVHSPEYVDLKQNVKWEKFSVAVKNGITDIFMESILVSPLSSPSERKVPLVIWPHGGPHSCAVAAFSAYTTSFVYLGFAVLLVNYRGSTGFGEDTLTGLLGKIGDQDVHDVQVIAEEAIKTNRFDGNNVFAFGGSHGGFLVSHLVARFPDFYKACCLRNPVISIPGMVETTDIPDWCYVESGFKYSQDILPTKDTYWKMLEKSPILYAQNIKCPVLLLIGGKDCRVPPYQGRTLYRALKAMNKIVKMLWYPDDCHPLNQVETEGDIFINVAKWYFSQLGL